jgi:hypothetical protein
MGSTTSRYPATGLLESQSHANHIGAIRARLEIATIAVVEDHRADVAAVSQVVDACAELSPRTLSQGERVAGIVTWASTDAR